MCEFSTFAKTHLRAPFLRTSHHMIHEFFDFLLKSCSKLNSASYICTNLINSMIKRKLIFHCKIINLKFVKETNNISKKLLMYNWFDLCFLD